MRSLLMAATAAMGLTSLAYAQDAQPLLDPNLSAEPMPGSAFVDVNGARMHYIEAGEGDPIVFLHGQPTSSYLWRNVMPFLQDQGRVIAPDLIGFGQSDRPDLDYTFQTHFDYVSGFMDALELDDVTLVVHDWGSILGLNWARLNEDRVSAVVFMEALVAPAFPMADIAQFGPYADTFRAFRDPETGPVLLMEQNVFIEQVLPSSILRPLTQAEMDAYRAPFPEGSNRTPLLRWPNELPIAGEPARNVAVFEAINGWLSTSQTPKLLIYFDPGVLVPPEAAQWMQANYADLDIRYGGHALHFVQEDQPTAIGRLTSDWLRSLN
ncbi:MAG: haloalkane dehalogenase [Pseudomonadota bacterium]